MSFQLINLNLEVSPSEKAVSEKIGLENWNSLKKHIFQNSVSKCAGCGVNPLVEGNENIKLNLHILPFSEDFDLINNFLNLKGIFLCEACHSIKHVDFSVEKGWFQLVNSYLTQKQLVELCRSGNQAVNAHIMGGHKVEKKIFLLKKPIKEYLEEILSEEKKFNSKTKVIFTKNFNWDNSR